ncbi:hypothetical protein TL16_g04463 [Triparma laevis f. inornata]|uniref:WW domain-containing protein n=1 Tax=Triparma laevis f. inornata TaxID=1714386 RepID=A0A9W7E655_9STRA|nr:hypothetical protein TL16_g04463 [Triparma laevis f. inornata]
MSEQQQPDDADPGMTREEWYEYQTEEGNSYYVERNSSASVWERPEGVSIKSGEDWDQSGGDTQEETTTTTTTQEEEITTTTTDLPMGKRLSDPNVVVANIRRRSSLLQEANLAALQESQTDGDEDEDEEPKKSAVTFDETPPTPPAPVEKASSMPNLPPHDDDDEFLAGGDWVRTRGVTFGDGTGADNEQQEFYRNTITGETSWERPDDLIEAMAMEKPKIGGDVTWNNMNSEPEMFKEEINSITEFLAKKTTVPIKATQPLHRLCELSQTCGSEEDWIEIITVDDFKIVKAVYGTILATVKSGKFDEGDGTENYYCEAFGSAVRSMVLFSRLHSQIWPAIPQEQLVVLLENVKEALLITSSRVVPRTQDETGGIPGYPDFGPNEESSVNLMFLTEFFRHAPGDTLDGYNSMQIFRATMQALFDLLVVASEDVFDMCGQALIACNGKEEFILDITTGENQLIKKCREDRKVCGTMIEVALRLLNENTGSSDVDLILLHGVLRFFEGCYESTETSDAVYTNDMNVLIDIALRECRNLEAQSEVRPKYIRVLHKIFLNSKWGDQRYRREELLKMIESFVDAGADRVGAETVQAVEDLLADCLGMLEF